MKLRIGLGLLLLLLLSWGVYSLRSAPSKPKVEVVYATDLSKATIEQNPNGVSFRLEGFFSATLYTPAGPLIAEGQNKIFIPYRRAGLLPFRLQAGTQTFEGKLVRKPAQPITPLTPKVGARATRVLQGKDPSLVIHPLDAQLNVSQQPVNIKVYYPDGSVWQRVLAVNHQVAWTYFPARQTLGTLKVVVESAGARAEQAEVDVLPGRLSSGEVTVKVNTAGAGVRDRWKLELSGLQDVNSNRIHEGLALNLWGRGASYDWFVTQPVVLGRLVMAPLPPEQPDAFVVKAQGENWGSKSFDLRSIVGLEVQSLPLSWVGKTLKIGPVVDRRGALPDDGTLAQLEVWQGQTLLFEQDIPLRSGQALWQPPTLSGFTMVKVELGGRASSIGAPR